MATILIIEDDIDLRKFLSRLLERENHFILEAENGIEAATILTSLKPDLVITDIIMPEQDGIGTINMLRDKYPEMKIIAISGGGNILGADYLEIARKLGAHYTFAKPFDNKQLVVKVRELLGVK
jgi:DNA-binding NtrC family response regulator